jgi:hypothetical protein
MAHRGCVGRHVVGARHGRRGPRSKDASRSVRPEPLSARHSQPWGQAKRPTNNHPARRPRALTGTWTTRRAPRDWTDWTPPPSLSARRGTAPPVPRTSRRRRPGSYLQPHRRRARAECACVTSNGHRQTAAQADKSRPPHRSAARSHHVKWLAPGAAPGWTGR